MANSILSLDKYNSINHPNDEKLNVLPVNNINLNEHERLLYFNLHVVRNLQLIEFLLRYAINY